MSFILAHFSFAIGFSNLIAVSIFRLIAIMLGRLNMTIDECIKAYKDLSSEIFRQKHSYRPLTGGARYSATNFEKIIKEFIHKRTGNSETLMMQTTPGEHCKVSVPSFLQLGLTSSSCEQFRCCRSS